MKYLIVQNKYHYTKKYLYLVELRLIYFVLAGAFQPYLGWKVVRCFKACLLRYILRSPPPIWPVFPGFPGLLCTAGTFFLREREPWRFLNFYIPKLVVTFDLSSQQLQLLQPSIKGLDIKQNPTRFLSA